MNGILDFLYAKKAWLASLWMAANTVYQLVVASLADKAITFDEANGVWMALGGVAAILGVHITVFRARNQTSESSAGRAAPSRGL